MDGGMRVVPLKCVSCGAALEISPDMEQFACGYCGASLLVERRGGTVALKRLTDAIAKVQAGTDRTAAELDIKRLTEEFPIAEKRLSEEIDRQAREMSAARAQGKAAWEPLHSSAGNCMAKAIFLAAVGVTLALVCSNSNATGTGIACMVAAIAVVVGGVFLSKHLRTKEAELLAQQKIREAELLAQQELALKPIKAELESIKKKLEQQRAIVDG